MANAAIVMAGDGVVFNRRLEARTSLPRPLLAAMAIAFSLTASAVLVYGPSAFGPRIERSVAIVALPAPSAPTPSAPASYSGMLDPALAKAAPALLAQAKPLPSRFDRAAPPPAIALETADDVAPAPSEVAIIALPEPVRSASLVTPPQPRDAEPPPSALPPLVLATVPVPPPRPVSNREVASQGVPRAPSRPAPLPRGGTTVVAGTPSDGRSFIEKLFDMPRPGGATLAYAAPEDGDIGRSRPMTATPTFGYDRATAVYDIAAHTVYMPNGDRLEAHSGLGPMLDDPRYVDRSMRGATPPHVYDLTLREQLFHGVRALRLNPIGGGHIFGRTGLLAHTYMLGPKGDSNGCVSFKNYDAFLRAYERGEVRRLAVVARQD